jgi:CHAD domain-containing protein
MRPDVSESFTFLLRYSSACGIKNMMKAGASAGRRALGETGPAPHSSSQRPTTVPSDGETPTNGVLTPHRVSRKGKGASVSGMPPDSLKQLSRALKKQWQRYRRDLVRCQKRFSEKSVHELRVAARRLLSTVELLEPFLSRRQVGEFSRCLKQHLDCFDDLRDTQVQLPLVKELRKDFSGADRFYDWLQKRETRFAKQTRERVAQIKTKPLARLVSGCRKAAERRQSSAPGKLVLGAVERAFRQAKVLRARIDPGNTHTIHRTRVAFKKFRYMVELLAERLLPISKKRLGRMHGYQTLMGSIQDAEVLLLAFDKFMRKKKLDPGFARRLRAELLRRRKELIRLYLDAADQLDSFWP